MTVGFSDLPRSKCHSLNSVSSTSSDTQWIQQDTIDNIERNLKTRDVLKQESFLGQCC